MHMYARTQMRVFYVWNLITIIGLYNTNPQQYNSNFKYHIVLTVSNCTEYKFHYELFNPQISA
jgi:hypothetical protein